MKRKNHIIFFLATFFLWFGFYLLGKPFNYFTDFSLKEILLLMLVTFFAIVPFVATTLLITFAQDYFRDSIWLSFYASIPLFIYDYIAVGIIEKTGFTFLKSHWFLTLGYFLVWIFIPITGFTLKRLKLHVSNQ